MFCTAAVSPTLWWQGRNSVEGLLSPAAVPGSPPPRLFLLPTRTPGGTLQAAEPFPGAAAQAAADPRPPPPEPAVDRVTVCFRLDKFHLVDGDFVS